MIFQVGDKVTAWDGQEGVVVSVQHIECPLTPIASHDRLMMCGIHNPYIMREGCQENFQFTGEAIRLKAL